MSPIVKYGLCIGVLCVFWTFVMGFTGWYKDPLLLNAFWLVVVIEIAVLIVGLGATAADGRRYWGQVGAGTAMAAIAAAIIFVGSFLFTSVVFPEYFAEIQATQRQMLEAAGKTPAEVEAAVEAARAAQTPLVNSLSGAIGTLVTGFVASLVIAAFRRAR